jgi:FAD/FMN-containing dehydrogenase
MIDRRPALIASCAGTSDVAEAVRFARSHDLIVAVRGGGHGVAGHATCDGGIVIDLSPMRSVAVDESARTVRAQGGAKWLDVDQATQRHALATPGGAVSDTGIAGLTLSGGLGWLRNKLGLTCDNLVSAEVVTADGSVLRASETEHPDLFWGLRGGGGNFGVVTSFEYRLHPIGPTVAFCLVLYPGDRARDLLRFFREYTSTAPDEVGVLALLGVVPPGSHSFPPELHGVPFVALASAYAGPADVGERALKPLREVGTPLLDASGPMPYVDAQKLFDAEYPSHEMRYYWKSLHMSALSDEAIDRIIQHARVQPSPNSTIDIWHNAGAISRVPDDSTAYSGRRFPYLLSPEGNWTSASDDASNIAWVRGIIDDLEPYSGGTRYFNFPGLLEEGESILRKSFGAKYDQLAAIKQRYDPGNLFRLNPNIRPTG